MLVRVCVVLASECLGYAAGNFTVCKQYIRCPMATHRQVLLTCRQCDSSVQFQLPVLHQCVRHCLQSCGRRFLYGQLPYLLPCPALPCPALPCPALPCPALPCPALPCPALPCPALQPQPLQGSGLGLQNSVSSATIQHSRHEAPLEMESIGVPSTLVHMWQVKSGGDAQAIAQSTAQAIGQAVATAVASASTKVTTTGRFLDLARSCACVESARVTLTQLVAA